MTNYADEFAFQQQVELYRLHKKNEELAEELCAALQENLRLCKALRAIATQDVEPHLKGNYIVLMQIARAALD